jgi:hypothetical protein
MWNQQGFAAVLVFLYAVSLITGAADPLGWVTSIAVLAFLTWFVSTVGVYCSLRASSTSRAMAMTLATLAVFNGNPIMVLIWFIGSMEWGSSYSVLGAMPSYVAWSMTSPETIVRIWATVKAPTMPTPLVFMLSCVGISVIFIYWATALSLRQRIARELDHWLDRAPAPAFLANDAMPERELEDVAAR